MISYKVKGIILAVIISLASIMMPFSVYADDYTGSTVVGFNTVYKETTVINGSNQYNYVEEFILDDSYVGYLNVSFVVNYYDQNGNSASYSFYGGNRYVNGSKFEVPFFITGQNYYNAERPSINNVVVTYGNHNLVKHSALNDLDQIISLLTDLYNNTDGIEGLESSQLTALQNIVSNTSLANTYLDTISKLRQYNIPIESWRANFTPLLSKQPKTFQNVQYWNYPVYDIATGIRVVSEWNYNTYTTVFIFGTSDNITESNVNDWFTFTTDGSYQLTFSTPLTSRLGDYKFIRFDIKHTSHGTVNISAKKLISNFVYIYIGNLSDKNISTDFALQWGLSNQLLEDLHIIANGTTQSDSAASDLESEASEYSDIADDVIGVEGGLTSNFETEVNKIDLNTGLNGFGGNFMTSATWVRTQFDRLTENTPYGSLVVYGLTLGFALLMLGKVFL